MKFKKISISIDDIARFRKKVSTDGECHLWKGKPDKDGYGVILCKKSLYRSHRIAYFIFNGNMDTDLVIDHMCKNRLCCNPMHLRAVTQIINASENTDAVKTHCIKGHEFTSENTYKHKDGKNIHKKCKKCHSEREKMYREKRKHTRSPESNERVSALPII